MQNLMYCDAENQLLCKESSIDLNAEFVLKTQDLCNIIVICFWYTGVPTTSGMYIDG